MPAFSVSESPLLGSSLGSWDSLISYVFVLMDSHIVFHSLLTHKAWWDLPFIILYLLNSNNKLHRTGKKKIIADTKSEAVVQWLVLASLGFFWVSGSFQCAGVSTVGYCIMCECVKTVLCDWLASHLGWILSLLSEWFWDGLQSHNCPEYWSCPQKGTGSRLVCIYIPNEQTCSDSGDSWRL